MSDKPEDRELEDYLHRKSALSLGYKRIYVEAPPPELDKAVTARARRALRFLGPAVISIAVAIGLVLMLNTGIGRIMGALLIRERHQREELAKEPIVVSIVTGTETQSTPPAQTRKINRQQWQAKINALRKAGKAQEADAEQAALERALASEQQKSAE